VIDLKAARSDPDGLRAALARKGGVEAFDHLMAADARWLELVPQVDELRSQTKVKGKPTPEQLEQLKLTKTKLQRLEEELAEAEAAREAALALVPNPPHPDVPDGETDEDAVELRRVGEPRAIENPRSHLELGRFDMDRAARLSGARFGYIIGDTALLALALFRFALDLLGSKGFLPVLPPVLVREEAMFGTGFFPTDKANIYEIRIRRPLPDRHLGGGARRTAHERGARVGRAASALRRLLDLLQARGGSGGQGDARHVPRASVRQGRDVRLRSPEDSWQEHERMTAIEEEILQALELPYRAVDIAAGDLGAPAARKIDLEVWLPSQGRYREVTSCSNTTDFQARRLKVRYRGEHGMAPVHTLNGTAAVGRMLLALLENGQQDDGSVIVPAALTSYGAPTSFQR